MRRRSASRSAITLSSWRSTASSPGSPIGPPASGRRDTPVRSAKHAVPCSLQSAPGGYVSTNARGRDEAAVRSGGTLAAPCRGLVRGLGPCKLPARPGLCVLSRVASVQVTLSPHADVLMVMRRSESVVLVSQAVAGLVDQGGRTLRRPESDRARYVPNRFRSAATYNRSGTICSALSSKSMSASAIGDLSRSKADRQAAGS